MTFYDFVIGFINDDTPLGSLANYIVNDHKFPKTNAIIKKLEHMLCQITLITNLSKALIEQLASIN